MMTATPEWNFAGQLVKRLGPFSYLIDAATGELIYPSDLPRLISGSAAALLSAGLRRGDRILISCPLSLPSSIAYLSTIYAGLVAVPVEDRMLMESGNILIRETGAKAVWTDKNLPLNWLSEKSILHLSGYLAKKASKIIPPAACTENDLALLIATSGSTRVPRFVIISHANLTANTEAIIRSQHLANDERAMLILPLSYCYGASVFHTHLYQGGGVVLDRRFMFPDKVLHAITVFGCTTFAGVPTAYNILLRRSNLRAIPLTSLRRFLQAGGPLAPASIIEMRSIIPAAKFYVMYGQTEATARISCLDPERLNEKLGSAGRPLDNVALRIVDKEGRDVPLGETGEILVKGPSISRGYLNDPQESQRVFKDGWLRTRDLAHMDGEGYIWIKGRMGMFLKTRGVRVSFTEVEARVAAVPGVYECAAGAVSHPEAGEALVLYIVLEKGANQVVEQVRQSLPAHWTCDSISIVSELPKTSSGKISRAKLNAR
jgi:acyl-CoA synthetase (AMP-forming)/AMP-acid ligase II